MSGESNESRHPLVGLIDETIRLNSRLRTVFATARQAVALNDSEYLVLNAVVEAATPPTVAQIGRSMGEARQLVQRAANGLRSAGFIEMIDNPDHKRAQLLRPTELGRQLKRTIDRRADMVAGELLPEGDFEAIREATDALRAIRKNLEARLKTR